MGFKPGTPKPEKSGRKPGTPNKVSFDARKLAEEKGVDPLSILLDIAKGDWEALGYPSPHVTKVNMGIEYKQDVIDLKDRKDAAREAVKYIYPALKSIEHTGKDGTDLFAQRLLNAQNRVGTLVGDATEKESSGVSS